MKTLELQEAARFLHVHPITMQRMARNGEVPAAKPGKRWVFLEIDLVEYLRAQSSMRVMQGDTKEVKSCRSTNAKILPSGGLSCTTAEKSYKEALGLPTR